MPAELIDGKAIARKIRAEASARVAQLTAKGTKPGLAVVLVGDDAASAVYVTAKGKACEEAGMHSVTIRLPASTPENDLLRQVDELNADAAIHGILVQMPLPRHVDSAKVLRRIDPAKDVDGFHPVNVGKMLIGERDGFLPCTPAGIQVMLQEAGVKTSGKNCVIVGRSNIVGKPMAKLLLRENATVTICHSRTADLSAITGQADILVAAIGRPGFVRAEHIGDNTTVIDVGINSVSDISTVRAIFDGEELEKRLGTIGKRGATLVGDVNYTDAMAKAAFYTPVPGGVGLLTVAMLMKNTVEAARRRRAENK